MTQEDKQLLLKDLCARLPYGVMCHINGDDTNTPRKLSRIEVDDLDGILLDFWTDIHIQVYLGEVKPYLRPMSSMTEEEIKELLNIDMKRGIFSSRHLTWHLDGEVVDYFNSHHFDYRGLIEKGLALEAPEGIYD